MIRKHVPNPSNPRERRRLIAALSGVLFVFVVMGAVAVAVGITAIVGRYAGFYAAVAVGGAFTFGYAAAGMSILGNYEGERTA